MLLIIITTLISIICFSLAENWAKKVAWILALIPLLLNLYLIFTNQNTEGLLLYGQFPWLSELGSSLTVGIDGLAMPFILLTNIVTFLVVLSILNSQKEKINQFLGFIFMMQTALLGVFMAQDALLFYVFWEMALIPIWIIIGKWGGHNKVKINFKFFIYTFLGSLIMFLALIYVYLKTPGNHSFAINDLHKALISMDERVYVLWAFFIAFAIKLPIVPLHTWQNDTYFVAPTQGTMLLSGIMLKMAVFGIIKWMLPFALLMHCNCHQNTFILLSVISLILASIIAIKKDDFKRLIAWSSVAHVGLISAGVFTFSNDGLTGSVLQSVAHGINVVGLFYIVHIIEKRTKTSSLSQLGGIALFSKPLAILFMIIMLGSIAVPFTNGFPGELLLIKSVFDYQPILGIISGLTIIFGAIYMLRAYQLSMFGETKLSSFEPLETSETITLSIIAILVIIMGIFPQWIINMSASYINQLLHITIN